MKQLFFLNLLVIIVLLAACSKIDVEPSEDTPVFSADFVVNNEVKNWQAGVDSFYMFADFEKGTDDVFVFTGELKMENCSVGCESLKIYIRDIQQLVQGNPNLEEALRLGFYEWVTIEPQDTIWQVIIDTTYDLDLDASPSILPNPAFGLYSWNLPDSQTASGLNVHLDSQDFDLPMEVKLTVAANNINCSGSQTRTIAQNGNSGTAENCSVRIVVDSFLNQFEAVASGTGAITFEWNTGDSQDFISMPPPSPAGNSIAVTVTDANGCTSSASLFYATPQGTVPQFCTAGFDYELATVFSQDSIISSIIPSDSLQLGKVILEYTDALGKHYRSDLAKQDPATAFFEIQSVEDYEVNEQGQQTKKIKVGFVCRLAGGNLLPGGELILEGTAVFAVAHP